MRAAPFSSSRRPSRWFSAAVFVLGLLGPARAEPLPLPAAEQAKVNRAIDKGVTYLKRTRGAWAVNTSSHQTGYLALPALTLLECGVPPTDPAVQKAADLLRRAALRAGVASGPTYGLSLTVLFLDRLGDPQDEELIQTLTLRLLAGQAPTGGWGYLCPTLSKKNEQELLTLLRTMGPHAPPGRAVRGKAAALDGRPLAKTPAGPRAPLTGAPVRRPNGLAPEPAAPGTTKADGKRAAGAARPAPADKPPEPSAALRRLTVLKPAHKLLRDDPPKKLQNLFMQITDNSNTQFAVLGLWAGRRHGVPMDRTLRLLVDRFETSQNPDGSWGYHYRRGGGEFGIRVMGTTAMTCVGLLGLAVGHGLDPKAEGKARKAPDPRIVNGFAALSRTVGRPVGRMRHLQPVNLYYLWSVERVAVLYDLPTIGDKDWYRWGAEVLVANQAASGSWKFDGFPPIPPTINTCFALLFLKRSNLVRDLTAQLPFDSRELTKGILSRAQGVPLAPVAESDSPGTKSSKP